METGLEPPEQRDVSGVTQGFASRIGTHGKGQSHSGQQRGRLLDGQGNGQTTLDPTVLRRRDPDRACDVGAAKSAIETAVSQLAKDGRR
jgi:hypothetical protein